MTRNEQKAKKISPNRLRNIALWYLDRFGGTRYRVKQVLQKRIKASVLEHGPEPDAEKWLSEILDELESQGYINDREFAASRIRKGTNQGKSKRLIELDLSKAGIDPDLSEAMLLEFEADQPDADLEAARLYVRRRQLGFYRPDPEEYEQRDMAKLARRGFSYSIARRALNEDGLD